VTKTGLDSRGSTVEEEGGDELSRPRQEGKRREQQVVEGKWSQYRSHGNGRTGVSYGSGSRDNNCSSQENNTKLLNYGSNFRRNSVFRLRSTVGTPVIRIILNILVHSVAVCLYPWP